jgi:hypothetical protein
MIVPWEQDLQRDEVSRTQYSTVLGLCYGGRCLESCISWHISIEQFLRPKSLVSVILDFLNIQKEKIIKMNNNIYLCALNVILRYVSETKDFFGLS